jgi:PAS domain S-box-containing protein
MNVSNLAVRILLEAAQAASVPRDEVIAGLGLEEALDAPLGRIRWDTFVTIMDRIFDCVGRDPERLRVVGGHMVLAPSFEPVKIIARSLVSMRTLYEMGNKWVSRALIPLVPLTVEFPSEHRVVFRGAVPEPYAGSAPLFWLFEGCMREVPRQLGLPCAVIEQSTITPRTIDTRIAYPGSMSLVGRAIKSVRAVFSVHRTLQVLERQRGEFERGLEAMQRGSDELRGVLDQLPDLLVVHRDGSILWANRAALQEFGYAAPDEIVGWSLLSLIDEPSVPVARARLLCPPGEVAAPVEVKARHRDGTLLTLELLRPQVVVFGGAPAGLAVARDVRERVRMQQQLILSDRLASLGVLAASVAHEINNPLACALGGLESVSAALDDQTNPRLNEALDVMGEGMDRVRRIVRDLRTLGQSDDARVTAVDPNAALESTLTLVAKRLAGRARVERDYQDVPPVCANPARLGQVLLNIVLNAIDAIPEGAPADNVVRLATGHGAEGCVFLEISDSGPGIPADVLGHIFDPFFTTKAAGQGTGLGLTICQRIVNELGGKISATSALGGGTTLRVVLPVAEGSIPSDSVSVLPVPAAARGREETRGLPRPRVLLVDDEVRLLGVLSMALGSYDVTTVSSVEEALERIAEEAYDVVVSDVMLPGLGGVDFFVEVERSWPELRDHFVFMTGGPHGQEIRNQIASTQRPCLEKPFRAEELIEVIETILRQTPRRPFRSHSILIAVGPEARRSGNT